MKPSKFISTKTQSLIHLAYQTLAQSTPLTDQVIDQFLKTKSRSFRKGYLVTLHRHLRELRGTLGNLPISVITTGQLRPIIFGFVAAPGTRRLKLSVMKTFFR
jgi:hypothetical protein